MTQAIAAVPYSLARRRRLPRRRLTSGLGVVGRYLLLAGLMLWVIFPFLWALSCSLRPIDRLFTATPEWLPHPLTFENYQWALGEPSFVVPIVNSFLVSVSTAVAALSLGSLAAYSLSRLDYPGKSLIMTGMLACQMLPTMLVILPIFLIFARVGLYNTLIGTCAGLYSLDANVHGDAAARVLQRTSSRARGAGYGGWLQSLGRRLCSDYPAIVAAWYCRGCRVCVHLDFGRHAFPADPRQNFDHQTAALSLFTMMQSTRGATNYGGLLAAGVLFTLPATLLFLLLQRPMLEGLTGAL